MVHITVMDQVSEEDVRLMSPPAPAPSPAPASSGAAGRRVGEAERAAQYPCPRCDSTDTKFCYYNNYNLAQPRHFCKGCRRYWTRGGALRNVPVGGGTRKATPSGGAVSRRKNRPSSSHAAAAAAAAAQVASVVSQLSSVSAPTPLPLLPLSVTAPPPPPPSSQLPYELSFVSTLAAMDPDRRLLDLGGSFSSLMAPPAPMLTHAHFATGFLFGGGGGGSAGPAHGHAPGLPQQPPVVSQAVPEGFWGMGWPDLSI
ncbi:hypothetical protein QYE76_050144 [Lolium multiflorum]|uniref:Dof zinc finger protein n=1 Tax=Lolium multiflorum TaxID=4521 RepID=A0AAD8SQA3_LOLMU|nr:hypothetical protein QYE76_050144 [Lolium multiflorum]